MNKNPTDKIIESNPTVASDGVFPTNKKLFYQISVLIVITITFFYGLFHYFSLKEMTAAFLQISPSSLIIIFLLFFLYYILRSLQLFFLFSQRIKLSTLSFIIAPYTMLVQLIPFRMGELSFLYFIKDTKKASAVEALVTLTTLRIFDVLILLFFFLITPFFLAQPPSFFSSLFFKIFAFSALVFFCILSLFAQKIFHAIHVFVQRPALSKHKYLAGFIEKADHAFVFLQSFDKTMLLFVFLLGIFNWLVSFLTTYLLYQTLGVSLSLPDFLFIASLATLFAVVPLQGIAGFGNIELSWGVLLNLFGIETAFAIQTTFLVHVIILLYIIIFGIVGFLFWFFNKRKDSSI